MFFADCDSRIVTRRAEQLRMAFAGLPHEELGNKLVEASYGVTEIQPGDTPDTMICRAKRALQMAKEQGRNKVVQLGSGQETAARPIVRLRCKFTAGEPVIEQQLVSGVPLDVSVEKTAWLYFRPSRERDRAQGNACGVSRHLRLAGTSIPDAIEPFDAFHDGRRIPGRAKSAKCRRDRRRQSVFANPYQSDDSAGENRRASAEARRRARASIVDQLARVSDGGRSDRYRGQRAGAGQGAIPASPVAITSRLASTARRFAGIPRSTQIARLIAIAKRIGYAARGQRLFADRFARFGDKLPWLIPFPICPMRSTRWEPHIDAQTMQIHHDKHHAAYVTNLNNAIQGTDLGESEHRGRWSRRSIRCPRTFARWSAITAAATPITRCSGP